jgi:hypothetical protein
MRGFLSIAALSIITGAALLLWPAAYNGWPLVFSDTGAFMFFVLERHPQWDKPIAYALFLHGTSWRVSYWGTAVAQALVVSHLAWLLARTFDVARWHLALVAGLAAVTAAPWFASQLMPDVFAAVGVLAVVLLAVSAEGGPDPLPPRGGGFSWGGLSAFTKTYLAALATLSATAHLSHLGVVLGLLLCIPVVRALCGLRALPPATPWLGGVAAASVAVLIGSNALLWGKPVISPYGSVFPLARQLANGPAQDFLAAHCPGFLLCDQQGNFPPDSDLILWTPGGPLWAHGDETVMAPEASRILAGTLRAYPGQVAWNALRDAVIQATKVRVGDSLGTEHLAITVQNNLAAHLPHEVAPFTAARQMTERLDVIALLNPVIVGAVLLSALALPVLLIRARDPKLSAAALLVLLALAGNAVITGATSKPHHRYQARVAWLLPMLAGVAGFRLAADKRATNQGIVKNAAAQRP